MVSVLVTAATNHSGTYAPNETKDLVVRTAQRQSNGFSNTYPTQLNGYLTVDEWNQEIDLVNREFQKSSFSSMGCLFGWICLPFGGACYFCAADAWVWQPRLEKAVDSFNRRIQPKGLAARLNTESYANCCDCFASFSTVQYRIEVFIKAGYNQQMYVQQGTPLIMSPSVGAPLMVVSTVPQASENEQHPTIGTQNLSAPTYMPPQQQMQPVQLYSGVPQGQVMAYQPQLQFQQSQSMYAQPYGAQQQTTYGAPIAVQPMMAQPLPQQPNVTYPSKQL